MNYRRLAFLLAISFLLASNSFAQDRWTQVRSKNFLLVGNAPEDKIRKVGIKLEQFREALRHTFSLAKLNTTIPTNVVVFKNDSSYRPFKPRKADGRIDEEIAGFFQSGEDVNYITVPDRGEEKRDFGIIFHEYVHFIINTNFGGGGEIPQWINEGLAEYYHTVEITNDIKITAGMPPPAHVALLQQGNLMPFERFLNLTNFQLLESSGKDRDIFYAQSWALLHHLVQSGNWTAIEKFLKDITIGVPPKTAFEAAFRMTHEKAESNLRAYVTKNLFSVQELTLNEKLAVDADMKVSVLDEATVNAYLGELLNQSQRPDEAEPYLLKAIQLNRDHPLANATLGRLKLGQRKFAEARGYFEKAVAAEPRDHLLYYRYANLLSREKMDEYGFIKRIEPATAVKMRDALNKAIAIEPAFAPSYELLAFVSIVNNVDLDAAIVLLETALKYQPGNQRYPLRIAEVLTRQSKFDDATRLAEKVAKTAIEPDIKSRALSLIEQIADLKQSAERHKAEQAALAAAGVNLPAVKRIESPKPPTDEETAKMNEHIRMRALNEILRKPKAGEQRVLGSIQRVDCRKRPIAYSIKTETEAFGVTSKDFNDLFLRAHYAEAMRTQVGCDANLAPLKALITYKGAPNSRTAVRGELLAVEFVPPDFRFMSDEEMKTATLVIYELPEPPKPETTPEVIVFSAVPQDLDARRGVIGAREINDALRKPAEGEKRDIGFLEKMDCTDKGNTYHLRVGNDLVKLISFAPKSMRLYIFAAELGETVLECGGKPIEFPAVFVYKPLKPMGEIMSLEFVPKSFVLN